MIAAIKSAIRFIEEVAAFIFLVILGILTSPLWIPTLIFRWAKSDQTMLEIIQEMANGPEI